MGTLTFYEILYLYWRLLHCINYSTVPDIYPDYSWFQKTNAQLLAEVNKSSPANSWVTGHGNISRSDNKFLSVWEQKNPELDRNLGHPLGYVCHLLIFWSSEKWIFHKSRGQCSNLVIRDTEVWPSLSLPCLFKIYPFQMLIWSINIFRSDWNQFYS